MKNDYTVTGNLVEIMLPIKKTGETVKTVIERSDLPKVNGHHGKWFAAWNAAGKRYYAVGRVRIDGASSGSYTFLHKFVLGIGVGQIGDHINGDSLDNRRSNLRIATPSQNIHNRRVWNVKKKYGVPHGVFKSGDKWMARIEVRRKVKCLGSFTDPLEAGAVYAEAKRRATEGQL